MLLGPISLVDCLVFCLFLAPQLLWQVGLFKTLLVVAKALPFLLVELPCEFIQERYLTHPTHQPPFTQGATVFEDFVIRCVRYAFANVPANVGRVFFSRAVALPFLRWRMLRHGYIKSPVYYQETTVGKGNTKCRGIWIRHHPESPPDFVLYYAHGGGFAMGSSYFYLEFLLTWHHLLVDAGFKNPAIFALEYTLVPDGMYPRQLLETMQGYKHVLDVSHDASKVCVAGDSAGCTLILSMLLELGRQRGNQQHKGTRTSVHSGLTEPNPPMLAMPRMSTLISPWVTLVTNRHNASRNDFLDRDTLWRYAHEYAGDAMIQQQPASPGNCTDHELWKAATPERGYFVIFGEEEVFAPDIQEFLEYQAQLGIEMEDKMFAGGIHAWPVASLFLSDTEKRRLEGLRAAVKEIRKRMLAGNVMDGAGKHRRNSD